MQISQETVIRIQPKGLMTIPIKFRRALGLTENNLARIKQEKGRLVIEPVRTLPYPVRSYTDREVREFLRLDAQESTRLRKRIRKKRG